MHTIRYSVGISLRSRNRIWKMLHPGGRRPMPKDWEFSRAIADLVREALDARDQKAKQ